MHLYPDGARARRAGAKPRRAGHSRTGRPGARALLRGQSQARPIAPSHRGDRHRRHRYCHRRSDFGRRNGFGVCTHPRRRRGSRRAQAEHPGLFGEARRGRRAQRAREQGRCRAAGRSLRLHGGRTRQAGQLSFVKRGSSASSSGAAELRQAGQLSFVKRGSSASSSGAAELWPFQKGCLRPVQLGPLAPGNRPRSQLALQLDRPGLRSRRLWPYK
eukprot:scaffold7390_cov100-Isochrysis_galbana.AAC.1